MALLTRQYFHFICLDNAIDLYFQVGFKRKLNAPAAFHGQQ